MPISKANVDPTEVSVAALGYVYANFGIAYLISLLVRPASGAIVILIVAFGNLMLVGLRTPSKVDMVAGYLVFPTNV